VSANSERSILDDTIRQGAWKLIEFFEDDRA
jgi:hypothetical protein